MVSIEVKNGSTYVKQTTGFQQTTAHKMADREYCGNNSAPIDDALCNDIYSVNCKVEIKISLLCLSQFQALPSPRATPGAGFVHTTRPGGGI